VTKTNYSGYRFPPEIIQRAIWLYARFVLSFRDDVEDLLAARAIIVSYETVRRWVNHFGPMIAADLRKGRPKPHATWHLDEVFLKINGRMVYSYRDRRVLCVRHRYCILARLLDYPFEGALALAPTEALSH
jgi:putative transposase